MTDMIVLEGVSKRYAGSSRPAVQRIDLRVQKGEILVLLGPSGCGKTTTLEMINRLVAPSSGKIFINGEDTSRLKTTELRRKIGYVIQDAGLFPHRTVAQNIATVPELLKWDQDRIDARVDELLEMVHLEPEHYRDRMPSELSGGQRQRVGVVRALAADPDVILMDEPFGALDPITREHLQSEFIRLQKEIEKTIVFVTHDIDEALRMGDRIALFNQDSSIEQLDSPMNMLTQPASPYVESFIGGDATMRALSLMDVPVQDEFPETSEIEIVQERTPTSEMQIISTETRAILVTDAQGRPKFWVDTEHFEGTTPAGKKLVGELTGATPIEIPADATMHDALGALLAIPEDDPRAVIVNEAGSVVGTLSLSDIQRAIAESDLPTNGVGSTADANSTTDASGVDEASSTRSDEGPAPDSAERGVGERV